jgi:hypothetical protein
MDFSPKPNDYILHECIKGNLEAVKEYLSEGKDLLHRNCFNDTLISMASKAKQIAVMDYLLEQGYPKYDLDGDRYHFLIYLLREDYCLPGFLHLVEKHQIDLLKVNEINRGGLIQEAITNKAIDFFKYFCEKTTLDIYQENKNVPKTLDPFQSALIHHVDIALYIYENYDFELTDKVISFGDVKTSQDFIPEYHTETLEKFESIKPIKAIKKEQRLLNQQFSGHHHNEIKRKIKV